MSGAAAPGLPLRWGILGTGTIAAKFVAGLAATDSGVAAAVGSRRAATADAFGERHGVARRHPRYEELVADDAVDAIYVATPNALHRDHVLLALAAGKHVLCEKPFALNAAQAREMVASARERGLFLAEAMWTRLLPAVVQAREWVREGRIGEVHLWTADFGFHEPFDPASALDRPDLGGGALLDVGVYPLSLAAHFLGPVTAARGGARLGPTGVDESCAFVTTHAGGALGVGHASIRADTPQEAVLAGPGGRIRLHAPWWRAERLSLEIEGQPPVVEDRPFAGREGPAGEDAGYAYEASAVAACVRAGRTEHPDLGLDETVALHEVTDALRFAWGVRYPGDPNEVGRPR